MKNYELHLDLDGVFANLELRMVEIFGYGWEKLDNTQGKMWTDLNEKSPNVFMELEILPGSEKLLLEAALWELNGANVMFLTALPRKVHMPKAAPNKLHWVRNTLKSKYQVSFGPYAGDKQHFCKGPTSILVDDSERNIDQWNSCGGVGILHEWDNVEKTLLVLQGIRKGSNV